MRCIPVAVLAVLLLSCTSRPSESDIQTAIAATQISQATLDAALDLTATARAPTATATARSPTATPIPTTTPRPGPEDLVLSYSHIRAIHAGLASMWQPVPIKISCRTKFDIDYECYAIAYLPAEDWAGPLTVQAITFSSETEARVASISIRDTYLANGSAVEWPSLILLPPSTWMVESDGQMIVGFSRGQVFCVLYLHLFQGLTASEASAHAALLAQQQAALVEDAGY